MRPWIITAIHIRGSTAQIKTGQRRIIEYLFAGDLYDGDWRDYQTGLIFVKQMGRLAQAKVPVFLFYGNHDTESQITREFTLPTNVSVFPARKAETFRLPHLNIALHGQSFRQRDITDNLVSAYPSPIAGCFNIGVLHTGLGGMPGHANYAPFANEDFINKGYDYSALAHVYQAAVLHERTHKAATSAKVARRAHCLSWWRTDKSRQPRGAGATAGARRHGGAGSHEKPDAAFL